MFQAYTVFVEKEALKRIHKQAYNLVNIEGYVILTKTDYEHANNLVYFLLEDMDYNEIKNYENNILIIAVNEIEDYGKKIVKK
jgi:hypothetical protein